MSKKTPALTKVEKTKKVPKAKTEKVPKPPKESKASGKPGPKPGELAVTAECPYCGGKAHRKAVQPIAGQMLRRHYCVTGCGHYHYRHPETEEIVDVGTPRVCKVHNGEAAEQIESLKAQLKEARKANSTTKIVPVDPISTLAQHLGIDPASLVFTTKNDSGRPQARVNCLSAADIAALPTEDDRNNVQRLHRALLTIQAVIGVYREMAQASLKSAKKKVQ